MKNKNRLLLLLSFLALSCLASCGQKNQESQSVTPSDLSVIDSTYDPGPLTSASENGSFTSNDNYQLTKVRYNDAAYLPYPSENKSLRLSNYDEISQLYNTYLNGGKAIEEKRHKKEVILITQNLQEIFQYLGVYDFRIIEAKDYSGFTTYTEEEKQAMIEFGMGDYLENKNTEASTFGESAVEYQKEIEDAFSSLEKISYTSEEADAKRNADFWKAFDNYLSDLPEEEEEEAIPMFGEGDFNYTYGKKIGDTYYCVNFAYSGKGSESSLEISFDPASREWKQIKENHPSSGETHTVRFLDAQGNVLKSETVPLYEGAEAPEEPEEEGKNFIRWDKAFSIVTKDIDVHPIYEDAFRSGMQVTYLDEDGNPISTATMNNEEDYHLPPNPSKPGHSFVCWVKDGDESNDDLIYAKPLFSDDSISYDFGTVAYYYEALKKEAKAYGNGDKKKETEYLFQKSDELAYGAVIHSYTSIFLNQGRALCLLLPHAQVYNNYGTMLIHVNQKKAALPYIENAVKLDPENPVYLTNLAELFYEDEMNQGGTMFLKAKQYAEEALEYVPDYGYALQLLETIYLHQEQPDQALDYLIRSAYTLWNDISIEHFRSLYFDIGKQFDKAMQEAYDNSPEDEFNIDFKNPLTDYIDDLLNIAGLQNGEGQMGHAELNYPIRQSAQDIRGDTGFIEYFCNSMQKGIDNARGKVNYAAVKPYLFDLAYYDDFDAAFAHRLDDSRSFTMGLMLQQYYSQLLQIGAAKASRYNKDSIDEEGEAIEQWFDDTGKAIAQPYNEAIQDCADCASAVLGNALAYIMTGEEQYKVEFQMKAAEFESEYGETFIEDTKKQYYAEYLGLVAQYVERQVGLFQSMIQLSKEAFDKFIKPFSTDYYDKMSYIATTLTDENLVNYFYAQYVSDLFGTYGVVIWAYSEGSDNVFYAEFGYNLQKALYQAVVDSMADAQAAKEEAEMEQEFSKAQQGTTFNPGIGYEVSAGPVSASITLSADGSIEFGVDTPFAMASGAYNFKEGTFTTTSILYNVTSFTENMIGANQTLSSIGISKFTNPIGYKEGFGKQTTWSWHGRTESVDVKYVSMGVDFGAVGIGGNALWKYDTATAAYSLDTVSMTGKYAGISVGGSITGF